MQLKPLLYLFCEYSCYLRNLTRHLALYSVSVRRLIGFLSYPVSFPKGVFVSDFFFVYEKICGSLRFVNFSGKTTLSGVLESHKSGEIEPPFRLREHLYNGNGT